MALSALPVQDQARNLPPASGKRFRNQLAAAVRSISWSYAIYWSISTNRPGVLTWKDGFYNGEIKTRKLATSSAGLTADQLVLQRSEQLRELYESLLSGECDHRASRPVASLSPEDLGDIEWYYTVCMTYAFRPGQGLPGRSFASNEHVWLCNALFVDTKTFSRALLAKTASIQTVVCIPFMGGVLELGTTDTVREDPSLVNRIDTSFWELQYPTCSEDPTSSPSENEAGEAEIVFEDLDHSATMDAMISGRPGHELGEEVFELGLSDANLERITREIDGLYTLCDELDVRAALEEEGNWAMDDGSFEVCTSSPEEAASSPEEAAGATAEDAVTLSASSLATLGVSRSSCFTSWKRASEYSVDVDVVAPPVTAGGEASQKLLKKAVAGGGAWTDTARALESCTPKNHVISERRRREKLNEMFLVLKSLVPSIHKVDKVSILAETIAYLKELERKVEELEASCREQQQPPCPTETTGAWTRRHDAVTPAAGKKVSAGAKRKASELGAGGDVGIIREQEHHWVVLSENDGPSNVSVTVVDKEVLLEVRCRWKELLMTRLFDAVKGLRLDVVSVQASTPDGLLALKIRAQSAGSAAAVAPGTISEALQKAIAPSDDRILKASRGIPRSGGVVAALVD